MTLREFVLEVGLNVPVTHIEGPHKGEWVMTIRKVMADSEDWFIVWADTVHGGMLLKENQSKPVDNFTVFRPSTH